MDNASVGWRMASEAELNTSITAALDAADTLELTPAQMVKLLDRSIAIAIAQGGAPTTAIQIGGQTFTVGLEQARNLRAYYAGEAKAQDNKPFGFLQGYQA